MAGIAPAAAAGPPVITSNQPGAIPPGHNWIFNDFFPRTLTITRGTVIEYRKDNAFHTLTLLPHSTTVNADLRLHGVVRNDRDDRKLNPNGTAHVLLNAGGLAPSPAGCGSASNPCRFTGRNIINVGNPLGPPPGPIMIKVSASPGLYAFHCRVHPKMVGHIRVLSAGSTVPSQASVNARIARQIAKDVANGFRAEAAANHATGVQDAAGHTTWTMHAGAETADGRVAIVEMLPARLQIRAGDKVVWRVPGINEPHTVSFPLQFGNAFVPMCENTDGTDSPAVPKHNPPLGLFDFTCGGSPPDEIETSGGDGDHSITASDGAADSGVLIGPSEGSRFGLRPAAIMPTYAITFHGAGNTFGYTCQIHNGMEGEIVVH